MPVDKFGRYVGAGRKCGSSPENVVTKQYVHNKLANFKKQQETTFNEINKFYTNRIDPLLVKMNAAEQVLAPLVEGYKQGQFMWHEDVQTKLKEARLEYERTLQDITIKLIAETEAHLKDQIAHADRIDSNLKILSEELQELKPIFDDYKQGKLFPNEAIDSKLKESRATYEQRLSEISKQILEDVKFELREVYAKIEEESITIRIDREKALEASVQRLRDSTFQRVAETESRLTEHIDSNLKIINTGFQELKPIIDSYNKRKPIEDVDLKLAEAHRIYEQKLADTSQAIIDNIKLELQAKADKVQEDCQKTLQVIGTSLMRSYSSRISAIEKKVGL